MASQPLIVETMVAVHSRRARTADDPPQLQPSIDRARAAQERDDEEELEIALIDVAVAAINSAARVRAARLEPEGTNT